MPPSLSLSRIHYINSLILSSLTGSQPFRYAPLCAFGKNQLENRQHEAAEQTFCFLCSCISVYAVALWEELAERRLASVFQPLIYQVS